MSTIRRSDGLTSVQLACSLFVIVLLVLTPPVIAHRVHRGRVLAARQQVEQSAARLRQAWSAPADSGVDVLVGPGQTPNAGGHVDWIQGPRESLVLAGLAPDPWGNQLMVNAGTSAREPLWVLSAGPNGIIETPFAGAVAPAGDDVGARVR